MKKIPDVAVEGRAKRDFGAGWGPVAGVAKFSPLSVSTTNCCPRSKRQATAGSFSQSIRTVGSGAGVRCATLVEGALLLQTTRVGGGVDGAILRQECLRYTAFHFSSLGEESVCS